MYQVHKKATVEQTATMRAWSEKNNLNVDQFRTDVNRELDSDGDPPEMNKKGSYIWYLFFVIFDTDHYYCINCGNIPSTYMIFL